MSGVTTLPPELPYAFEMMVLPMYHGDLSAGQSFGLRKLLQATTALPLDDRAYVLATVFHETARTMALIREYGQGAGKAYGPLYYGRGPSQITWLYNYSRFGVLLGVDLVRDPDRALDWDVALPILVLGMQRGLFTGRALSHYFGALSYGTRCNPIDARAIINGSDCAALIAGYFWQFRMALERMATPADPAAVTQALNT